MHRSIRTAIFVISFSAGTFGIAAAQETARPSTQAPIITAQPGTGPIVAAQPSTTPVITTATEPVAPADTEPVVPAVTTSATASSASAAIVSTPADTADASANATPTAGVHLAMWNAPSFSAVETSNGPAKPLARLRRFASGIVSRSSALASSLTRSAMRFIGVPYVFGGTRTTGFDCSGYVQHVFSLHGLRLPRTADAQFDAGQRIRSKILPGDLVFFHTYAAGVSHVGIYLGRSKFVHASSSRGVAVSSLHDRYWAPRYLGAKRVVGS